MLKRRLRVGSKGGRKENNGEGKGRQPVMEGGGGKGIMEVGEGGVG